MGWMCSASTLPARGLDLVMYETCCAGTDAYSGSQLGGCDSVIITHLSDVLNCINGQVAYVCDIVMCIDDTQTTQVPRC
jgi:hypothetical protein